jgi:RND family efflux transporter MFP subunit
MMKIQRYLFLCAIIVLFFSGCEEKPSETEKNEEETKVIPAFLLEESAFIPTIEIFGSIKPKFQSTVAAETAGTVHQIYVTEGDFVYAGQNLLTFSHSENIADIELQNAKIALNNAENSLKFSKQQAQESEKSSKISVQQNEENLKNLLYTDTSTETSVDARVSASENVLELREITLKNAKENLQETRDNLNQQEKNINQNLENIIANGTVGFRAAIESSDSILGVSKENREENNSFEVYLGFKDQQTKIQAINNFRVVFNVFLSLEEQYFSRETPIPENEFLDFAYSLRSSLQEIDIMLQKSISGHGFSEGELESFRSRISAERATVETIISSVTSLSQQKQDFLIQKPQTLRLVETSVQEAEVQYVQAEKNLEEIRSGGEVSKSELDNRVLTAKNSLKTSKLQLKIVKEQNKSSIQQAQTIRDNAKNALKRAELEYSKLSVSSPIHGVVIKKDVEVGNTVFAGNTLFLIAQIETLSFHGEIQAEDLPHVKKGQKATLRIPSFENQKGYISKINPVADAITRRISLEISFENPNESIPANIFANALISLRPEKGILFVPENSLLSRNPPSLFMIEEWEKGDEIFLKVKQQTISLGRKSGNMVEVTEGLLPGQRIVAAPIVGLKDGDEVSLLEEEVDHLEKEEDEKQKGEENFTTKNEES